MRRGSEWWNEGVKVKVEEKKRAFEEWLQCNSMEKYERLRDKNVETKRKVEEAKRMSNGDRILIGHRRRIKRSLFRQNTYLQNKKHMLTCQRWDWLL